jgi:hypothetical protein
MVQVDERSHFSMEKQSDATLIRNRSRNIEMLKMRQFFKKTQHYTLRPPYLKHLYISWRMKKAI